MAVRRTKLVPDSWWQLFSLFKCFGILVFRNYKISLPAAVCQRPHSDVFWGKLQVEVEGGKYGFTIAADKTQSN